MDVVGRMRERLTVQEYTATRDNMGGVIETYADKFETWCGVRFLTIASDEKVRSEQLTSRTSVQFTIRTQSGVVSAADRIVFKTKIYEVDAVVPSGNFLEFQTLECYQISEFKTAA